MSDVPIIGDNTTTSDDAADKMPVFYKAVILAMDEQGNCFFVDRNTRFDVFTEATANDCLTMARGAADELLMQRQAAVTMRTQMAVAAQVQEAQQNQALLNNLSKMNLKTPR